MTSLPTDEPTYKSDRAELLPFLPPTARRVLDIGCGPGGFGRTMLAARPDLELYGVEPDGASVTLAEAAGYRQVAHGFFPDAAEGLPGPFDTIWMNDVLEHMTEPEAALQAAHAHLAPGGTLIASIPNVAHISVWLPLLRHQRWDYRDIGIMDRTHVHMFTRPTMREAFAATGWEVQSLVGINRSRWGDVVIDSWKVRAFQKAMGRRGDDFVYSQFVLTATSPAAQ